MGGGKREGGRERGKGACVRETKSQLRIAVSTSTVYPTRYAFHTLNGPSKYSVYVHVYVCACGKKMKKKGKKENRKKGKREK